jgi:hypothetical protein
MCISDRSKKAGVMMRDYVKDRSVESVYYCNDRSAEKPLNYRHIQKKKKDRKKYLFSIYMALL